MKDLLATPMFGILVSLAAFECGLWIQKKTKLLVLNPLLIAIALVMAVLVIGKIDLATYQLGGDVISLFLGPATVVLAVPLYQQVPVSYTHLDVYKRQSFNSGMGADG